MSVILPVAQRGEEILKLKAALVSDTLPVPLGNTL